VGCLIGWLDFITPHCEDFTQKGERVSVSLLLVAINFRDPFSTEILCAFDEVDDRHGESTVYATHTGGFVAFQLLYRA
jgi:hypothetical protein